MISTFRKMGAKTDTRSIRILIVEDNPDIAENIAEYLELQALTNSVSNICFVIDNSFYPV